MKRYPLYKDSKVKWIGDVPEHWNYEPFGRHFRYFKGLSITKADLQKEGIPVISYGQIHSKENRGTSISSDLIRYVSPAYLKTDPQSLVQKCDFIFADTSEDLDGCGNYVCVDQTQTIFAGYHTLVCRPYGKIDAKYLAYQFLSAPWRTQLRTQCNAVKVYSISRGKLKKTVLLMPPEPEQRAIVAYLDRAVEKIDGYVAAKEAEIEKLGTLKQSVIAKAVTQGLNPDAPMKDSGIPWLGNVPEHWKWQPLNSIASIKRKCGFVDEELLSVYLDRGVVRFSDIKEKRTNTTSLDLSKYQLVEIGDFVLNNQQAWRGSVGVSLFKGIVSPAYFVLKLTGDLRSSYANYLLRSPGMVAGYYIASKGIGSIQRNLDWNKAKRYHVLIPPADEQQDIVNYISRKTQEIDGFIAKIRMQIDKLKLYKQRLISDVVTGKIDVRDFEERILVK